MLATENFLCEDLPMAANETPAEITTRIAKLTWEVETRLPSELARTTHARSVARIRREMGEAQRNLSRAVTDLGSALQEQRGY